MEAGNNYVLYCSLSVLSPGNIFNIVEQRWCWLQIKIPYAILVYLSFKVSRCSRFVLEHAHKILWTVGRATVHSRLILLTHIFINVLFVDHVISFFNSVILFSTIINFLFPC